MELHFDESFFKEEVRDGFHVSEMMKRCWAAQLVVLSEFDKVCKKHFIRWFADSGTLLGAVRHKGFIPWDDDIDIAMLRPDYEKFVKIAVKDLPPEYEYLSVYNTPDYVHYLTRVVNHGICWPPKEETLEKYYGFPYVCGLDITPIDFIPRKEADLEVYNNMIELLGAGANCWENPETTQEEREDLLKQVQELTLIKIDRTKPIAQQLRIMMDEVSGTFSTRESDRVGYSIRQKECPWYNWPKQNFFKVVDLPFECTTLPCPIGYEENLSIQYGENYMTPYPYYGHGYPFYRAEMEFLGQKYPEDNYFLKDRQ